ncbi:MAG: threonine/serine dehydratase [Planctomycetota bacterium]
MTMVSMRNLLEAQAALKGVAIQTPLLPLKYHEGGDVWLKCENLQRAGAFKLRGAYNRIRALSPAQKSKGVVAHSSGNHAQGVALASKLLGVRATIVTLNQAIPTKVEGTRRFGAEVIFGGEASEEIRLEAIRLAEENDWTLVPPFNDPFIIAGQGTVGLEIIDVQPETRAVVVPIGGGGLCAGICLALKETNPDIKVIGVEPEKSCAMSKSLEAGELVRVEPSDTIADGLKPVQVGDLTFDIVRKYIDEIVTVSDEEILEATRHLILREKLVVEPSGAATVAAIMQGKLPKIEGGPTVAILSGGNVELSRVLPQ